MAKRARKTYERGKMLKITNLHAAVDGKEILKGFDIAVEPGHCGRAGSRGLKRLQEGVFQCHLRTVTAARVVPGVADPSPALILRIWSDGGRVGSSRSCRAVARAE
jgi:hypothetical protein